MRSALAVLLTVVGMYASSLLGPLAAIALLGRDSPAMRPVAGLSSTVVAVVLVWLVRRHLYRRPWSGVRLTWDRRTAPGALLGVSAGFAAIAAAGALSVALGAATWAPLDIPADQLIWVPVFMISQVVLLQAFPEELWWRGHLFDVLSERHAAGVVLVVGAVGFGAMHIVSDGGQNGTAEHLLYVLQAIGLGFLCGAARHRTGTVWAAVGAHTGFHLAAGLLPTTPVVYGAQLTLMFCLTTVTGLVLLLRRPAPARTATP